jgi:RES domain-containing protein
MRVYRISKTKYAEDLNGMGSKLYGGRWNKIGTPCIYTSESRALAILEYSVNVNIDFIPRSLSICVFEIDPRQIHTLDIEKLPGNWRDNPTPLSTKEFGSELFSQDYSILKIPSVVIPEEWNYVLNPMIDQPDFKLVEVKDFVFDLRIKG